MGTSITPCIWLDDQAEAAAALYAKVWPNSRVTAVTRYPKAADNPGRRPRGSVLTVELDLTGQPFTLLNGGPSFTPNPSVSFFAHASSPTDADRMFAALSEGGQALMPLGAYPWSERYGWIQDRFGVSWQVMAGRRAADAAAIVPCLMFSGPEEGRAEAAIHVYTRIFPDARTEAIERYAAGEGPVGNVKHGRFMLAGHELTAMDSHVSHGVTFNEALSFQVMCNDQRELDRYWEALADGGGTRGPCGWLKDRFGLSWQVVPAAMARWMSTGSDESRDRAFAAMLEMQKLDIGAIERAWASGW